MHEEYNLPQSLIDTYSERLEKHITAVQEFGRRLGIDEDQLERHDRSKWYADEFVPYAVHFCGGHPKEDTMPLFVDAWLKHMHRNPHHWQYWIFPDNYDPPHVKLENGAVPMPDRFAMEMIADWHGAGFAYSGDWDIQKWLYENMPRIRLHSKTADFVRGQLDNLGYADVVFIQRWAHEKQ